MRMLKSRTIMIALAAVLCISTVIGAAYTYTYTYAAQTAQEEGGSNATTTQGVDIEVEYWNGDTFVRLDSENALFQDAVFEPGKMVMRKLRIANVSSETMDYGVEFIRDVAPADDLAEVLEVYFGLGHPENRSYVLASQDHKGKLKGLFGEKIYEGTLSEKSMQEAYLALYLPQGVSDEYQDATTGSFDIKWGAASEGVGRTNNN